MISKKASHAHAGAPRATSAREGRVAIYFEPANGCVRMAQTTKVDTIITKLNRTARGRGSARIIIAFVLEREQAKKLRRVLSAHWASQYRGGGIISVLPAEVEQVAEHLTKKFGLTCYGLKGSISTMSKSTALNLFARGTRARRVLTPGQADQSVLDEMLAAGIVRRHVKRKTGEVEYIGTEKARTMAQRTAQEQVPARGHLAASTPTPPIIGEVVVPDPYMTPELLRHRMDEHEEAGGDPQDVLRKEGYQGAVVNLRLLIGGLAAVTEIDEFQIKGATQFRHVAEHGQLGGAKAIDYSAVRVQTSMTKDAVLDAGSAARGEYEAARAALKLKKGTEKSENPGLVRLAVAERMIVHGQSVSEIAAAFGYGKGGSARAKITSVARDAATVLARHFGFIPSRRSPVRFEGDQPVETG